MSTAIIEVQTQGGTWMRIGDCSAAPETINAVMVSNARSNPQWKKFRAIDAQTKQLLDMQFF